MQVAIDPVVLAGEPHLMIAFIAPTRRRRSSKLVGRESFQILRRGNETKHLLVIRDLTDEKVEPLRSLEPPVTEELRVVRCNDQWWTIHRSRQPLDLFFPI